MLHEEVKKYRELSGDTNPNTPISRIGGYLDGYEKALEQELCDDAISRQAALSDEGLAEFHFYEDYAKMRKYLMSLPPVIPSRPTGHWIIVPGMNEQCSNCKKFFPLLDFKCRPFEINYCPNCGAHMMESEVNTEESREFEDLDDI